MRAPGLTPLWRSGVDHAPFSITTSPLCTLYVCSLRFICAPNPADCRVPSSTSISNAHELYAPSQEPTHSPHFSRAPKAQEKKSLLITQRRQTPSALIHGPPGILSEAGLAVEDCASWICSKGGAGFRFHPAHPRRPRRSPSLPLPNFLLCRLAATTGSLLSLPGLCRAAPTATQARRRCRRARTQRGPRRWANSAPVATG